jgi:hypothetical protein
VKKKSKLSDETIEAVVKLGEVLRPIANRLIAEGKAKVENGKIVFLEDARRTDGKRPRGE